jgi:hypothetical protein
MKASFFEIDGIIAKDFLKKLYNDNFVPEDNFFNTDILDAATINPVVVDLIKEKHLNNEKIIIITNRDIKFDIVTNHWLSRNFKFSIETHFRPIYIDKNDFPLFKTGMVSLLIDMYKFDEIEIYMHDVKEISLVFEQLRNINKKIFLTHDNNITLIEE